MRANFVMNFSVFDFLSRFFSTSSRILDAADCEKSLVTRILSTPFILINPDRSSTPSSALLGTDSPVSAEVSISEMPSMTVPSSGILSPGLIMMISPGFTFAARHSIIASFLSTRRLFRPYVNQGFDGFPGTLKRQIIEKLSDLIKKHHGHAFRPFSDD